MKLEYLLPATGVIGAVLISASLLTVTSCDTAPHPASQVHNKVDFLKYNITLYAGERQLVQYNTDNYERLGQTGVRFMHDGWEIIHGGTYTILASPKK